VAAGPGEAAVLPPPTPAEPTGRVEILWDTWGIPHIFAKDEVALLWAFAFAQMQSHGDLLLRLYGESRGRAAEYWGEDYLESDRWVRLNGIPERAREWAAKQDPLMKLYLDAFAAGINAYAETYPDSIADDLEVVLPVTAEDVLAHTQRVLQYTFVIGAAGIDGSVRAWQRQMERDEDAAREPGRGGTAIGATAVHARSTATAATGRTGSGATAAAITMPGTMSSPRSPMAAIARSLGVEPGDLVAGSNAWAIGAGRAAGGRAMLLANPHLPWSDLFTWYEAQLVGPGLDAYGAALVGFPLPGIAFNEALGWTHTVNTIDAADLYELELVDGGYAWDGGVRPFERTVDTLRVRQADGKLRAEPLVVLQSIHGPVIAVAGERALALRVAGLDRAGGVEQNWRMLRARSLAEFETALSRLQLPMFNVVYADRDGHILYLFNGQVPRRSHGDARYWAGIVPGDSPATLWTDIHPYADLPRIVDPPDGWVQNANDPPWSATLPRLLDPSSFPAYMSPDRPLAFRPQRSIRMLMQDSSIAYDEMVAYKHSTRVESADHILEDVVLAARSSGSAPARLAANVLDAWDRTTNADSRGAVLYEEFFGDLMRHRWPANSPFDAGWSAIAPLATPDGLSDPAGAASVLEDAAARTVERFGRLDIPWGDVNRLQRGDADLPASGGSGGMGVFRVLDFREADAAGTPAAGPRGRGETGQTAYARRVAVGGDSFIAAIEFGPTIRASGLLAYGNASRNGSPHQTDQLNLAAAQRLRPIWRTRTDIEAHLERRAVY